MTRCYGVVPGLGTESTGNASERTSPGALARRVIDDALDCGSDSERLLPATVSYLPSMSGDTQQSGLSCSSVQ